MNLNKLIQEIEDFRNERNWKQFHKLKDMIISLNLESKELLELCQWKSDQECLDNAKQNTEKFADELADIFYWVLIISNDLEINLEKAFKDKMEQNRTKYPKEKSLNNKEKYSKL